MRILLATAAALLLTGCTSPYVVTTVANRTGGDITVMQIDYPSASFGTEKLANDADFHYRFKLQGSGPIKLSYTDAAHHDHTITGPNLIEGQRGTLRITIDLSGNATFAPQLTPAH
jgi:hypothetical protein